MVDTVRLVSGLGILLVGVGVGAYVLSDFASVTALIPAIFGILVAVLALMGRRTNRQRSALYGVGLLSLLGVAGSARGIPDVITLLSGEPVESTVAAVAQGVTIAVSLVLLAVVAKYAVDER